MKVIGLSEFGGPEVLQSFELPDPRLEPRRCGSVFTPPE